MKSPYRGPNNKSAFIILWIFTFTGFNVWITKLNNSLSGNSEPVHAMKRVGSRVKNYNQMNSVTSSDEEIDYLDDEYVDDEDASLSQLEHETSSDRRVDQQGEEELSTSLRELIGGKRGNIAWLMSFPNSGTSFTSLLIRHASNATTASNYGMECNPGQDGKSVPVHDWSSKGPYWLHPPSSRDSTGDYHTRGKRKQVISTSGTETGKSGSFNTPPAGASVLTKTHCGSRCTFCPPEKYLETWQSFLVNCLSGSRSVPITKKDSTDAKSLKNANTGYQKIYTTYHPSLVEKAVHLIRNPFDNLVSRFHHEQKEHKKRHDTKWTGRYSNDAHGFSKWCADEDRLFRSKEQNVNWELIGYEQRVIQMHFEGVSCHAEFFRYVQWHNLAVESVQKLEIPVIYIHYEDYTTNLQKETDRMLHFLNMTRVGTLPIFDSNKDYSDYFSLEERAAASELMRVLASDSGKKLIERYWVGLDFRAMRKQIQAILD